MACHIGLAGAGAARASPCSPPPLESPHDASSAAARRRVSRARPPAQPSVAEVRCAIGIEDAAASAASSKKSAFMDLISSTPIGQPESEPERRLREAAEWVVDATETRASQGQKSFLVLCMMTFPAWLLLLFIALEVIKLPFDAQDLDNILM